MIMNGAILLAAGKGSYIYYRNDYFFNFVN